MTDLPVSLSYLLAVDLFALTALAMAAAATPAASPRLRRRLLWATFGLSLARSFSLLLFLRAPDLYARWGGSLEISSVVLVGWALKVGWGLYEGVLPLRTIRVGAARCRPEEGMI